MTERDPRWEDVYAIKSAYWHMHDESFTTEELCLLCGFVYYRLDIYYNGGHYWRWQVIDGVDFRESNVNFEVDKWIWAEMIKMVDDDMKPKKMIRI